VKSGRYLYAGAVVVAVVAGLGLWKPTPVKAVPDPAPQFRRDPTWPAPLPAPVGYNPLTWPTPTPGDNAAQRWVFGEAASTCVDADGHVFVFGRGWEIGVTGSNGLQGAQSGAIVGQDASASAKSAPPILEFNSDGQVLAGFGDPHLVQTPATNYGDSAYLPHGSHGCFVDFQGNLWIGGNGDGVVQRYNPAVAATQGAAATWDVQIGTKNVCDGNATASPINPTCSETTSLNSSHTMLSEPADITVDPDVGPVSGTRGDVYIADGYGNHRVVVFGTSDGGQTYHYVGQWGQSCGAVENPSVPNTCPGGTFGSVGGGHPHCVVLGNDGLVYVCDRPNNRIQVFKKTCARPSVNGSQPMCTPDRIIYISNFPTATPANLNAILLAGTRACDIDFWPNKDTLASLSPTSQNYIINVDLGNDNVWVMDKVSGITVGALGRCGLAPCPGHEPGDFAFAHTVASAPDGNTIYVAETITGRRLNKFIRVEE
jgi:hypothetical protein